MSDYADEHANARSPMARWLQVAEAAAWSSMMDVRNTFRSADAVRVASGVTVTVFNIGGNNHRLVALIDYEEQELIVKAIMTHAEYDKDTWKDAL
ncbi:MAG: type II toxin-antitoxin system HigB family toxin [Phycisphaera sp.]|nr:type II toxin-antitoxin system HigB family toxin [Phycisphaera sp.]